MRTSFTYFLCLLFSCFVLVRESMAQPIATDLLIVGGGASGTMAGIQAARMGVKAVIIEETEWLGGMLTGAGVSAIDGNHNMPAGLWGEFRQKLYAHYGGPAAVETGWVSNTLFEPTVGNKILKEMVAPEKNLTVLYKTTLENIKKEGNTWQVTVKQGNKKKNIRAKLLLDATELGDVLAAAGAEYRVGMDDRDETGEAFAPEDENDIIQDLTYVVTLQDFGKGADKTIPKPAGYKRDEFKCACDVSDPASFDSPQNNCFKMMQYGKLPNNKYMINWPKCGNDIYLNLIDKSPAERQKALQEAKLHTLRFLYYLQTELGYKNLGIANEYPTADKLPMIPYHRESRRLMGLVTLTLNHVSNPYEQPEPLYRTGIAVGDYTIDHHHYKNPQAPAIDFVKIKVPSYNVPLGALIPAKIDGLIVAEKSISVTNIVNGATRLQPVVLTLGQAAGALAAISIQKNIQPREVTIREVQQALLNAKAYLMPFIDIKPSDQHFEAIQRIGATGVLKGTGVPYKWANQTWFYPERPISEYELVTGLRTYYLKLNTFQASGKPLTLAFLVEVFKELPAIKTDYEAIAADWKSFGFDTPISNTLELDRRMIAVLLDKYLNPFALPINFKGTIMAAAHQ